MSGLGGKLGLQRVQIGTLSNASPPFIPPDDLDISDRGYTSSNIDEYLIYHAFTLGTNNATMDIMGNEDPTEASAAAREELNSNYVLIFYNDSFLNPEPEIPDGAITTVDGSKYITSIDGSLILTINGFV
jgi:hypothetical protein